LIALPHICAWKIEQFFRTVWLISLIADTYKLVDKRNAHLFTVVTVPPPFIIFDTKAFHEGQAFAD